MSSLAAILLGLASSSVGAAVPPVAQDAPASQTPVRHRNLLDLLDLRLTERGAPRKESRWRLLELREPVAEEGRSMVRWGWKKVTLRLPFGPTR